MATRTGIHRRNQLETGGEIDLPRRAGDGDLAAFQRLSQAVEDLALELRQLIKKQDPIMCQRDFPWFRLTAAVIFRNK